MRIDIVEKAGITVDGNQVRLGDSIETAKKILGKYDVYMNDYYLLWILGKRCGRDDQRIQGGWCL